MSYWSHPFDFAIVFVTTVADPGFSQFPQGGVQTLLGPPPKNSKLIRFDSLFGRFQICKQKYQAWFLVGPMRPCLSKRAHFMLDGATSGPKGFNSDMKGHVRPEMVLFMPEMAKIRPEGTIPDLGRLILDPKGPSQT